VRLSAIMAPGVGMSSAGLSPPALKTTNVVQAHMVGWGMTAAAQRRGNPRRVDDVSSVREFGRMGDPFFPPRSEHLGVRYEIHTLSFLPSMYLYLNGLYTMYWF
jgi:hypothetical protein